MAAAQATKKKKTGGRKAGTPNKITSTIRGYIQDVLEENKGRFSKSLDNLEPNVFAKLYVELLQYAIPKKQSVSVEAQIQAEYKELKDLLAVAPDEVVAKIAERIIEIQNLKR